MDLHTELLELRFLSMSTPLKLTEVAPTDRLCLYVRAFQVLSTAEPARVAVLDFGGADVSLPLSFGDPIFAGNAQVLSAALVGPRTRSVWLRFEGKIDQVNVSFFPGAAAALAGVPMSELVDRVASPQDIWPHHFREAVAELAPLPLSQRISRLSSLLLASLEPCGDPDPQVREAVRLIQLSGGRARVRWLAEQVNLSVSQLERRFRHRVGLGPKRLARQTRAARLAAAATSTHTPDWALLAHEHGYADQAHLVREFEELMGLPPKRFAAFASDADFLQDALAGPPAD
jgi:AraC-like DNA-binding protein